MSPEAVYDFVGTNYATMSMPFNVKQNTVASNITLIALAVFLKIG